ncbi:MAG: hypothetical protein ACYCTI_00405 [Acidimicrobiales bacterium]
MAYCDDVRGVVAIHRDEIRADLEQARQSLRRSQEACGDLQRHVDLLEGLLAVTGPPTVTVESRGRTLHEVMVVVLEDEPYGLRAGDLAAEINRRGLYRMRDGRPVEAQQIHARVGNYSELFAREGTFIKLKKKLGE